MGMTVKGSWKSINHNTSHFVPDDQATSLCGLVTLDVITGQKWGPPGNEGHLCGKCVALGATLDSKCPCLACSGKASGKT